MGGWGGEIAKSRKENRNQERKNERGRECRDNGYMQQGGADARSTAEEAKKQGNKQTHKLMNKETQKQTSRCRKGGDEIN